jgi:hypothetical protein
MKFHLYRHRTAAHVKVPLATPEIIELNEIITTPFSIQEYYETSSPIFNNTQDDLVNSSSSIIDSSKQTKGKNLLNYNKSISCFI